MSDGTNPMQRPEKGEIWQHVKKGHYYLILGYIYNTITDKDDVHYIDVIKSGNNFEIKPDGKEFSRQLTDHKKAFLAPNEDGQPRFVLVR